MLSHISTNGAGNYFKKTSRLLIEERVGSGILQIVTHEVMDLGKDHPASIVIKNNLEKYLLAISDIEMQDAEDLADKMLRMLRLSEEERREMGARGRGKMVREFDERIALDKYMEVIRDILA